jgi:hypothetical protein
MVIDWGKRLGVGSRKPLSFAIIFRLNREPKREVMDERRPCHAAGTGVSPLPERFAQEGHLTGSATNVIFRHVTKWKGCCK